MVGKIKFTEITWQAHQMWWARYIFSCLHWIQWRIHKTYTGAHAHTHTQTCIYTHTHTHWV